MTLMSIEESQEDEHHNLYFLFLLDFLSFSAASIMALTKYRVLLDNASMIVSERFILEQLNLTKDVVSEIKRINSFASEVVKAAHAVIDAVIRLCIEYSVALKWDICDTRPEKVDSTTDCEKVNMMNHAMNITKLAIEKLCELGVVAANDGGSLVTILNASWKGVVNLLQHGRRVLMNIVSVQEIIVILISLVIAPLRCAAEAWSSLKEAVSVSEARRVFLPVKFYLINALKISSLYPCQVYRVHREVILCAVMISTFRILLGYEKLFYTASKVFSELLEKTSIDLLNTLLNSAEVTQEHKFELLDWLFIDECSSNSINGDSSSSCSVSSMAVIFCVTCENMPGARQLLLGRVALFHQFLTYSSGLEEDVRIKITRKLGWFLDLLVDEEVYSSILDMQIPVLNGSGKTVELVWQPIFYALLHALKTFMIVASSSFAWMELENFLLENLFHPHFLCREIVIELWCFLVRHAEIDKVNGIISGLCSLMKLLESPKLVIVPGSPLRKLARAICLLLTYGTPSMVENIYSFVVDDRSQLSSLMYVALLLEGFPLNSLSDSSRSIALQKIITDYFACMGSIDDKFVTACDPGAFEIPVLALSASLQSHQVCLSDVEMKTLKFLLAVIRSFRHAIDKLVREHYYRILSETLRIFSHMKHLYQSEIMEEVVLELQNLFIVGPTASDSQLHLCKPYLALFMGGLGDMEMPEIDDSRKCSAVWELYHMLFRERHWALVHLAIAGFGYFAARTSCNQLWRFVPENATLSYDLIAGNEANEERFMSEFKAFLEKEVALLSSTPSFEQLELLVKDGIVLKEIVQNSTIRLQDMECENLDIEVDDQPNKRRKLPDGIGQGVEILQSGLKVIGDGLSQWQQNHFDSSELHEKFLAHFASLENVIVHLMGLVGNR